MDEDVRQRLRLDVTGAVQGVGFRPFVHRLASSEGLGGFVRNTGDGVSLEVEGETASLARFLARLDSDIFPPAEIRARSLRRVAARGEHAFAIAPSTGEGQGIATVLPDLATCAECAREIFDPADRRYRYPFTTCVRCGPRYSIIAALPYDRERTAMRGFAMCAACRAEYDDPASRRFHAETNACPRCGPQLALLGCRRRVAGRAARCPAAGGSGVARGADRRGQGAGRIPAARRRAQRDGGAAAARAQAAPRQAVRDHGADARARRGGRRHRRAERDVLHSPAAPIVLVRARPGALAPGIAPGLSRLGVMLPTTPLHHLLLRELGVPGRRHQRQCRR